ncbi:TonB-dependent receptor [Prolixibacteraceae bacterium Z1-6]|uniref:TonB-dependent receptor n=1 Tax=Draconibacterium aestuarii TaxID=2998507 RepID=A0A9X3FGV1_9BACT|nr:TonB-dependent receptor [Prolixibacteraceae bacterium Z1-6]
MKQKLSKRKFLWNFSEFKVMLSSLIAMTFILSSALYSSANGAQGDQKKTVTGTVISTADNLPIIGASVVIEGTTLGTVTNFDGEFTLEAEASDVLIISFIGYTQQRITVGNQTQFTINLEENVTDLEEVVVVGYGVQKKKLVTGATVQVSGDDLQKMSTGSPLAALQSQTPGVNITQNSGQPGEGFKVNIRGIGTTGDSNPLYVIDGVAGGDINTLNPSDIESIDVLKDAASSAIYGARAANGVILVTTKKGKSGQMQVSYDGFYGIQNPYKVPATLNAQEYMTILNEVNFNDGIAPYDWATMIPGIYNQVQNGWQGTNWLKEIENTNAPTQNHAFNLTGGSEASTFSLGISYMNQEGIYGAPVEPNYERYTVRLNSEHIILKKDGRDIIKFGENLNYSHSQKMGIGIGNIYWNDIHNMISASPLIPVYNESGDFWAREDMKNSGLETLSSGMANPIASMYYNRGQNISMNHNLNMNGYFEVSPIENLVYRSSFGYRMNASSYRSYTPAYELSSTAINTIDKVSQNMSMGYSWTWENTVAYSHRLNEHSFSALIGQSIEKWGMGENLSATGGNSIFSDFDHAWLDNTPTYTAGVTTWGSSPWGEGGIASFFGRLNYNYKETYMLSLVMRADGSANFAKGNRWGYFPSVSAGWVMTNESFMDNNTDFLDFLKLRASWGQNGNANIDNFQYLATVAFDDKNAYSFGNAKTSQAVGGYADILPNPDITWETSEQLNLGVDARFIDSRLGLALDYYIKTTRDWLVVAPQLASYGTGAPWINGGDVENKGFEIALGWNDKAGDFSYGVNLNLTHNKNEVTRIANSEGIIHGEENVLSQGTTEMYRAEVGKPIGYFWGYKTAGVFQNADEIEAYRAAGGAFLQDDPQPGDLIFVDTNGDGEITIDDKVEIGNPHPDFTMGLSFNVSYKGWDLSVTTNGAFGHQIAKSYRSFADTKEQNYTTDIFGRWHGEGTSNKLPRLTSGSRTNWQEISDIYIEDAGFLKIQNITVGYDFKKLFENIPFGQARLYFTAQNLYTFTNYSGQDPEIGYGYGEGWVSGIDLGFYPSPRTYLVGVNLKF